jgi:hypothetical protein
MRLCVAIGYESGTSDSRYPHFRNEIIKICGDVEDQMVGQVVRKFLSVYGI